MQTIVIHIFNEDPIVAEVDQLPQPYATSITVHNPRLRDGKRLPYLESGVTEVFWPLNRINFIEVRPDYEPEPEEDDVEEETNE